MFPRSAEWRTWSTRDRIGYIAQLAAALSLLPTVIFAWLGWREARMARTEQMQYFVAEKAPDIEISAIKIIPFEQSSSRVVTFYLKNIGGSPVYHFSLALYKIGETTPIIDTANPPHLIFNRAQIAKGKELMVPLIKEEELRPLLGAESVSMRIARLGESLEKNEEIKLLIHVTYQGRFGDDHSFLESVAIKRNMLKQPPN